MIKIKPRTRKPRDGVVKQSKKYGPPLLLRDTIPLRAVDERTVERMLKEYDPSYRSV